MIEQPIVLILGAGASIPYGFPSGGKLKQVILEALDPNKGTRFPSILNQLGVKSKIIKDYYHDLYFSGCSSVDAFLEHRPEFVEVGKLSIAISLIPFEKDNFLFKAKNIDNSWCHFLFSKMKVDFNSFDKNRISIITFNYDRSIEHFLFTVLINSYGKSEEQCAEKIRNIPIIHVYGRLGALPWQESQEIKKKYDEHIDYDSRNNLKIIYKLSEQINIISDDKLNISEFNTSFENMSSARYIYFLGFGYNETNMKRLRIKDVKIKDPHQIRGTAFNLGQSEIAYIKGKLTIDLADSSYDCLAFMKNNFVIS